MLSNVLGMGDGIPYRATVLSIARCRKHHLSLVLALDLLSDLQTSTT